MSQTESKEKRKGLKTSVLCWQQEGPKPSKLVHCFLNETLVLYGFNIYLSLWEVIKIDRFAVFLDKTRQKNPD